MSNIFIAILIPVHVIISLLIILIVLMQRPKSEGLGAAFGGGVLESFAGVQTTNVLQTATRYLGGALFVVTLVLAILYSRQTVTKGSQTARLLSEPAPAIVPNAVPSPTTAPSDSGTSAPAPEASAPAAPQASPAASTAAPEASASPAAATNSGASAAPAASPSASGTNSGQ